MKLGLGDFSNCPLGTRGALPTSALVGFVLNHECLIVISLANKPELVPELHPSLVMDIPCHYMFEVCDVLFIWILEVIIVKRYLESL